MKRVRFESPLKLRDTNIMFNESECHSPRPFVDKGINIIPPYNYNDVSRILPYVNDPIKKFENGNSSPYPTVRKTCSNFSSATYQQTPSSDLELSMLDFTNQEPWGQPQRVYCAMSQVSGIKETDNIQKSILSNTTNTDPPNILKKTDDFFLKRENIGKLSNPPLYEQVKMLTLDKENNPLSRKTEIMQLANIKQNELRNMSHPICDVSPITNNLCKCHHCVITSTPFNLIQQYNETHANENYKENQCCIHARKACPHFNSNMHISIPHRNTCKCQNSKNEPHNAIDKKTWAIQKYEQNKKSECLDIEPQNTVVKEKREPTVADLFKIIKLQNEQLQLLQEKVDNFIATSKKENNVPSPSHHNYVSERVALQSVESEQHKISIGVMTSFEMVRTSTVINKEVIKQSEAQIQCNRSQISIKEVISKAQPVNINFLEGISKKNDSNSSLHNGDMTKNTEFEDKTLNELSLYNVHVDNATTPLMSPEQTMYLDVKDYSDSDTESDDPSNVGWTYYNKVMTRVNGMLQDSDMPSSASALYRNAKQKCLMQIDKTNVSVTKRVTFGENPVQMPQPAVTTATTDTSLKMNQLAAKYLNNAHVSDVPFTKPVGQTDMSFATKNYMERHRLLQGTNVQEQAPKPQEIPKFLDITVLKQQPKLI